MTAPTNPEHDAFVREAKQQLGKSIQAYCDLLGVQYVMNWVIVVDIATPESERRNVPMIGVVTPPDQSYVATRGLLAVANADPDAH